MPSFFFLISKSPLSLPLSLSELLLVLALRFPCSRRLSGDLERDLLDLESLDSERDLRDLVRGVFERDRERVCLAGDFDLVRRDFERSTDLDLE